ncbi:1D-myo-inositol 2-acetamido-2-deoxy-alpha-D-glucopyranoside deacetylase [uncultured archaeon]|nr:1D-myo-inositol 2-acetamido-2-deoxy-alpha-D-glucopyranoside deacetylase [uncultured archaeon]
MGRNLVVVAHPDDETIWMGGRIIRGKDSEWAILSLCRKDDPDRKPKFFNVCGALNARGFISDLDDDHPEEKLQGIGEVVKRIEPIVADKEFDCVFTHGGNGEYGHNRHIEANAAVLHMVREGRIKCKSLFEFDYLRVEKPFMCVPNPDAKIKISLSGTEFDAKRRLITKAYGFLAGSFEAMSCSATESFRKVL